MMEEGKLGGQLYIPIAKADRWHFGSAGKERQGQIKFELLPYCAVRPEICTGRNSITRVPSFATTKSVYLFHTVCHAAPKERERAIERVLWHCAAFRFHCLFPSLFFFLFFFFFWPLISWYPSFCLGFLGVRMPQKLTKMGATHPALIELLLLQLLKMD